MKTLVYGEKRYISIKLSQKSGTFTISGATFEVRAENKTTILESGQCGVDGTTVWMLFDTTKVGGEPPEALYAVGDTLYVYYWVTITDTQKIVNGVVRIEITR